MPLAEIITAGDLAKLTGISLQNLGHMVTRGEIEREGYGKFKFAETIQRIIEAQGTTDLAEKLQKARLYNLEQDGRKKKAAADLEEGISILREEVRQDALKVASIIESGVRRWRGSIPPAVCGLEVDQIEKKVAKFGDELLREFGKETAKLCKAPAKKKAAPKKKTAPKKKRAAKKKTARKKTTQKT